MIDHLNIRSRIMMEHREYLHRRRTSFEDDNNNPTNNKVTFGKGGPKAAGLKRKSDKRNRKEEEEEKRRLEEECKCGKKPMIPTETNWSKPPEIPVKYNKACCLRLKNCDRFSCGKRPPCHTYTVRRITSRKDLLGDDGSDGSDGDSAAAGSSSSSDSSEEDGDGGNVKLGSGGMCPRKPKKK